LKFPGFKPVVREINPRCLFPNALLVLRDITWRNIMLSWIMFVTSDATPIKAMIKFSTRRGRNGNVFRVQRRRHRANNEQPKKSSHRTTVGKAFRLPNWQPDSLFYPKHVQYEEEDNWKDLTKEAPRSPRVRVGGYAIL